MIERQLTQRLHDKIVLVAPIDGICLSQRRIDFAADATSEQRAAAQAILDAFDPVAEQAAVEAEEADERDRQDWQRTKARAIAREIVRHVKALETVVKVKFPNVTLPDWTIED
jgi:hypothetical protein